jgi:hypothetical protein
LEIALFLLLLLLACEKWSLVPFGRGSPEKLALTGQEPTFARTFAWDLMRGAVGADKFCGMVNRDVNFLDFSTFDLRSVWKFSFPGFALARILLLNAGA